jgi:DNA-binding beta-propeller fold protein YncE
MPDFFISKEKSLKNLRTSAATCIALLLVACAGSNNIAPSAPTSSVVPAAYKGLKALYVVDQKHTDVQVLENGTYTSEATITNGLAYPRGDWLDADGSLYVGDGHNGIIEYKPGASSPSFTYTAHEPNGAVTTDRQGNVYEGDTTGGDGYGGILEYKQGMQNAMNDCSTEGNPYGVAVDATGDVFAAVDAEDGEFIAEFKGGLKGCKFTTLLQIGVLGGMVLDKSGNLVVCEPQGKAVAVIAPPYTKVTRTLGSGYGVPESVTLSSSNKLAFVTDVGKNAVFVVDYMSGKLIQTINKANGLKTPVRAVDGPNAVY